MLVLLKSLMMSPSDFLFSFIIVKMFSYFKNTNHVKLFALIRKNWAVYRISYRLTSWFRLVCIVALLEFDKAFPCAELRVLYGRSWSVIPCIVNCGTVGGVSAVCTPLAPIIEKRTPVLHRSEAGRCNEEKTPALSGVEPRSSHS